MTLENHEAKCHKPCLLIVGCFLNQVFYCSRLTCPFRTVSHVPLKLDTAMPPFTALSVLSSVVCPLCPLCPVYSVSTLPPTFPLFASSHHPASQTYVTDHCNPVSSNTLGVRYTLMESTSIMLDVIHHERILLCTIPEKYSQHTWAKQICVQGLREKYPDNTHSFCFDNQPWVHETKKG